MVGPWMDASLTEESLLEKMLLGKEIRRGRRKEEKGKRLGS